MNPGPTPMLLLAQAAGRNPLQPFAGALLLGVFIAVVVMALVSTRRARKARHEGLSQALIALGFTPTISPPKASRPALFVPFAGAPELSHGAKGLQWAASGTIEGVRVDICEHMHMRSTGKSAHPVYYTAAAVECPAPWPALALTREHWGHAIAEMLGQRDVKLDSDEFNKRWRVHSKDADFALLFLSPQTQEWLKDAPKNEAWRLGAGRLVCVWSGNIKPEAAAALAARPVALLALAPPELAAWGSPSAA